MGYPNPRSIQKNLKKEEEEKEKEKKKQTWAQNIAFFDSITSAVFFDFPENRYVPKPRSDNWQGEIREQGYVLTRRAILWDQYARRGVTKAGLAASDRDDEFLLPIDRSDSAFHAMGHRMVGEILSSSPNEWREIPDGYETGILKLESWNWNLEPQATTTADFTCKQHRSVVQFKSYRARLCVRFVGSSLGFRV
jgi:hypothetical protein